MSMRSEPKLYEYHSGRLRMICATGVAASAMFLCLPFYLETAQKLPAFVWAVSLLTSAISLSGPAIFFVRARPLEISEQNVSAFMFGRLWKSIKWREITRIEKFRIYDGFYKCHRDVFLLTSDKTKIRFDDWIDNFSDLIVELNVHINELNIPAYNVDRGRDTQSKIDTIDSAERKQAVSKGIRTQVTKF